MAWELNTSVGNDTNIFLELPQKSPLHCPVSEDYVSLTLTVFHRSHIGGHDPPLYMRAGTALLGAYKCGNIPLGYCACLHITIAP